MCGKHPYVTKMKVYSWEMRKFLNHYCDCIIRHSSWFQFLEIGWEATLLRQYRLQRKWWRATFVLFWTEKWNSQRQERQAEAGTSHLFPSQCLKESWVMWSGVMKYFNSTGGRMAYAKDQGERVSHSLSHKNNTIMKAHETLELWIFKQVSNFEHDYKTS